MTSKSPLPIIAIVGATGSGKTALSLDTAEVLIRQGQPAEIVNADAMQLYQGMDIGTAKIPPHERRGIPHHLLDIYRVTDEPTVADYQERARHVITDLHSRHTIPILVGGSGLYLSAALRTLDFPARSPELRSALESELAEAGAPALHERLRAIDPEAAAAIDPANSRRVIRALEVNHLTGEPFRPGTADSGALWHTPTLTAGVHCDRDILVERLSTRVTQMWKSGLVEEVRQLLPHGLERGVTASRAIGYAQAIAQIRGTMTEQEAVESTVVLTRKYARRQVGWFRRYPDTVWADAQLPARAEAIAHDALAAHHERIPSTPIR